MKKKIGIILLLTLILSTCFVLYKRAELQNVYQKEQKQASSQTKTSILTASNIVKENVNTIARDSITFPERYEKYASISVERIAFEESIYYGDTAAILDIGIGHYMSSGFPGEGRPILTAGHNGIHFKKLRDMQVDDMVVIQTSYGTYEYKITNMEIQNAEDFDTNKLSEQREYLIMYCCYPFDSLSTDQRYFVYADYVSGPRIT